MKSLENSHSIGPKFEYICQQERSTKAQSGKDLLGTTQSGHRTGSQISLETLQNPGVQTLW